jgi:NAD(P)H-flavin reductase
MTPMENLKKFVGEAIIMSSPASITAHVVSIRDLDDKTKMIGLEIPKQAEACFDNKQFVAVYHSDRRAKAVEASTFPIVTVRHNAHGASVVYIAVRVDETHDIHSMSTFLYENGRPMLSAKLVF